MKSLFENNASFDLVSLRDLGSRYLTQGNEQIKVIGFQRNAVWKEEKVEALWDSFLSGFPIGSLLLARQKDFWNLGAKKAQYSRANPSEDTLIDETGEGFVVVDGQQRLNGIAQGFMNFDQDTSHSRLWIDLAEPTNPDQHQFEFYLCTSDNPFGVNGSKLLTLDEKRRALKIIEKEYVDDSELSLMDTYPYKSKLPVPFYEFWQYIKEELDKGNNSCMKEFESFLPKIKWNLSEVVFKHLTRKFSDSNIRDIENELIEPLKKTVLHGEEVNHYQVPVILVQKINPKRLGKLFERVNISGEVPPQPELFFSALKLRYPLIGNYVAHVYNNDRLRGLLKPTDIVLIAIRLIDPSIRNLELNRFDRIIKDSSGKLIELLEPQSGQPSQFTQCLSYIYDAIHYDEVSNPVGLPRLLISSLRPRVWQTMAIWVNANYEKIKEKGIQKKDRLNLIRYGILDAINYFIEWRSGLSNYINGPTFISLPVDSNLFSSHFPALEIFRLIRDKLINDRNSIQFLTPLSYNIWLKKNSTPTSPSDNQLSNEGAILMFAQRHYLTKWENLHLDVDHIIPSHWMVFRAGSKPASVFWKVPKVEMWNRYKVLNRTGNYRFWPNTLNRADHDKSPLDKFIHRHYNDLTNLEHTRIGLSTVKDILDASAIELDDAKQWENICEGPPKVWTDSRFASFKQIVTRRRYRMYKQLFEAMQWDEWIEIINGS